MNHIKADFSKLSVIKCLYHRTFMSQPYPTLHTTVDGEYKEFKIRHRAAKRDKLYHKKGLPAVLVVYDGIVLAYEIIKDANIASDHNLKVLHEKIQNNIIPSDWYFDNERFYRLNSIPSDEFISCQQIHVIDPIHLTYTTTIDVVYNDVFVISQNGEVLVQSTPVATSLDSKINKFNLLERDCKIHYISLSTLLTICKYITRIYDPEEIEKFDLTQYMIRHKTINLSKMPVYVKDNSSTIVPPIEMLTYLMGLLYREHDSHNIMEVMKCIKLVCRSGVINIKNSDSDYIFTDKPIQLVKVKSIILE